MPSFAIRKRSFRRLSAVTLIAFAVMLGAFGAFTGRTIAQAAQVAAVVSQCDFHDLYLDESEAGQPPSGRGTYSSVDRYGNIVPKLHTQMGVDVVTPRDDDWQSSGATQLPGFSIAWARVYNFNGLSAEYLHGGYFNHTEDVEHWVAGGLTEGYGGITRIDVCVQVAAEILPPLIVTRPSLGYWLVAADGGIFAFGDARFYGSTGSVPLNRPIVGMASTPTGLGYWLVASDGGVFAYGDAVFYGSAAGLPLNSPVAGMAVTPTGKGYWLVAADGGVFAFGDARFYGSTGGTPLNRPIVGMASTPTGNGYWLVASDGGVFAFGDAAFYGSVSELGLPVLGLAAIPSGGGYWLVTTNGSCYTFDGGTLAFGQETPVTCGDDADSLPAFSPRAHIVGMDSTSSGLGYWLASTEGDITPFGDAVDWGGTDGFILASPIVGVAGHL